MRPHLTQDFLAATMMSMKLKELCSNRRGFTLIELIAVLAILVLVVGVTAPLITGQVRRAKVDATKVQINSLEQSLNSFNLDCGYFPTTEQGLDALKSAPTVGRQCKNYDPEGYLKKNQKLSDPFDQPYTYVAPGTHNTSSFDLSSSGPDGTAGNDDDITNWGSEEAPAQ